MRIRLKWEGSGVQDSRLLEIRKLTTGEKRLIGARKEYHCGRDHERSDGDGNIRRFTRTTASRFEPCRLLRNLEPLQRKRQQANNATHGNSWDGDRLLNVHGEHFREQHSISQKRAHPPQKVKCGGEGHGHQRDGHGIHLQGHARCDDHAEAEPEDVGGDQNVETVEDNREVVLPLANRAGVRAPNACRVDAVSRRRHPSIRRAPTYVRTRSVLVNLEFGTMPSGVAQKMYARSVCLPIVVKAPAADEGAVARANETRRRCGRREVERMRRGHSVDYSDRELKYGHHSHSDKASAPRRTHSYAHRIYTDVHCGLNWPSLAK
jgi:hypothetical protein